MFLFSFAVDQDIIYQADYSILSWQIELILFWKSSGALDMPKGNLLKQYRPYGVINVVNLQKATIHCWHPVL